jgi:hypothetical protein
LSTKIITPFFKTHNCQQIIESINEVSNTQYYGFISNQFPYSNTTIPDIKLNISNYTHDVYRTMIAGKRLTSSSMSPLIKNIPYQANKVFAMYDDQDQSLAEKDYYCVVNASAYYHVFKCLDNNLGANSTIAPDFSNISGANTIVYQTSDGYRWKYMYTSTSQNKTNFGSAKYFPVTPNTTVQSSALVGAIDIIKIDVVGEGYDNYTTGIFSAADCRINGNSQLYAISTNNSISQVNGFYTGCLLYLTGGTGVGQYTRVSDYFSNSNGNFIVINTEFLVNPLNGTSYELYPEVIVTGSGTETINTVARALINSLSSNSVFRIEVLMRGTNYTYATANVIANNVVGVTAPATVRPIKSPAKGHGSVATDELGANFLGLTFSLSNSEANTIPINNQFAQIGILKDPTFANTVMNINAVAGAFVSGEMIYKIKPVLLNQNCTINTTSAIVTCNSADFQNQVSVNDMVYIKASNNTIQQLAVVNSITNSSSLVLTTNGYFACTSALFYFSNTSSSAKINNVSNTTSLRITSTNGVFVSNDLIIGQSSGARATINTVSRNDTVKSFDTFVQLYKYVGVVNSGTFIANETVYQTSLSTANASVHSVSTINGQVVMYTTQQLGIFRESLTITGVTSGAIFTISNAYSPEIVSGSGEILYVENITAVSRSNNTSELIKLVFEY